MVQKQLASSFCFGTTVNEHTSTEKLLVSGKKRWNYGFMTRTKRGSKAEALRTDSAGNNNTWEYNIWKTSVDKHVPGKITLVCGRTTEEHVIVSRFSLSKLRSKNTKDRQIGMSLLCIRNASFWRHSLLTCTGTSKKERGCKIMLPCDPTWNALARFYFVRWSLFVDLVLTLHTTLEILCNETKGETLQSRPRKTKQKVSCTWMYTRLQNLQGHKPIAKGGQADMKPPKR